VRAEYDDAANNTFHVERRGTDGSFVMGKAKSEGWFGKKFRRETETFGAVTLTQRRRDYQIDRGDSNRVLSKYSTHPWSRAKRDERRRRPTNGGSSERNLGLCVGRVRARASSYVRFSTERISFQKPASDHGGCTCPEDSPP
jgi:hypothetical protein